MNDKCEDCLYWHKADVHGRTGVCRINPPVFCMNEGEKVSGWPTVLESDWCGKYQEDFHEKQREH